MKTISPLLAVAIISCWLINPAIAFQTVAYTHATVETLTEHGQLENATILMKNGKIVEVGVEVTIPDEAKVVSMRGKTIIPGIIESYMVYKRIPQAAQETETVTFGGRTIEIPSTRGFNTGTFDTISDYFYPQSFDFSRLIKSGITTMNLVSDGRGLSVFADSVLNPTPAMVFENKGLLFVKITNETAALDIIRNGLNPRSTRTAPQSGQRREGDSPANRETSGVDATSGEGSSRPATADSNAANLTQALWNDVREGKKSLVVNANNAATVAHLLHLLEKHPKVKVILVATGPNVYESLDAIKGSNISLVLQPGIDTEPYSARKINVAKMAAEREIPFSLSLAVGSSQMAATLDEPLFPVAALVKTGLSRESALTALTLAPARMLGIETNYGSIESGKFANLLVFDGDPLATGSRLNQVIVKGSLIHEN